jgi:hypothetical protein
MPKHSKGKKAKAASSPIIVNIEHDLERHESWVTIIWPDDDEVVLPIKYGTGVDDIVAEADKAAKKFGRKLADTNVRIPKPRRKA